MSHLFWWLFGEKRDGWGGDQLRERLVVGGWDCHKRAGIDSSGGGYRERQGKLLWVKRGSCRGRWKWLWAVAACAASMGEPGCVVRLEEEAVRTAGKGLLPVVGRQMEKGRSGGWKERDWPASQMRGRESGDRPGEGTEAVG